MGKESKEMVIGIGDVVRPKCRPSPEMVVNGVGPYGDMTLVWFLSGERHQCIMRAETLERVNHEEKQ